MSAFQAAIPRYFIERYAGKEALGLFASASQLTTSGNTVVGAIGAATLPRLAKWRAAGSRKFWVLARQMVLVGAGLGVAGVLTSLLIGRQVLTLVYRPEFAAAYPVLVVLSLAAGAGFVAQFQGWVHTAARVLAVQPLILGVTLAVLAGCSAVLVPLWGSMGAAWALFASAVVQILASEIVLRANGRDEPAPATEGSR
jgi:O-antigen/teichoic acid export membrane protein